MKLEKDQINLLRVIEASGACYFAGKELEYAKVLVKEGYLELGPNRRKGLKHLVLTKKGYQVVKKYGFISKCARKKSGNLNKQNRTDVNRGLW